MLSRLSLSTLIELCRVLRHYLGAGLSLAEVFQRQEKRGPSSIRDAAGRIARHLEQGDSLEQALKDEQRLFPPLFLALASVGERSGMMPEVFAELESYFLRQRELRRQFLGKIAWPVVQFCLAVVVLTVVIYVMGQIGSFGPDGKRFDPLGLGLFGAQGAAIFFFGVVGIFAAAFGLYFLLSRLLGGRAAFARLVLRLPVIGPCAQALALSRFCLGLRLTTETGMPIAKALRLSLRATSNAAFVAEVPTVERIVGEGDEVAFALSQTGLIPEDFQRILEIAEVSGTFSEVLKHQGDHYHEESSRRLGVLTAMASYGVWAFTGICIIVAIFRMYGSYLSLLR